MGREAWAFWVREPGAGEIRPVRLAGARARTRCSSARCAPGSAGAPRRWCSAAGSPPSQYDRMRAPFQEGDFPGPVKYGYLSVGVVEQGPADAASGRTVFCLHPHQTAYVVPAAAVAVVPDGVPARRAVLAGHRRDGRQRALGRRAARRRPGGRRRRRHGRAAASRGCWPGSPASRSPWSTSTRPGPRWRPRSASASRCRTTRPAGCDLVVHTSATSAGLQRSLELLAPEGTVVELSWYGDDADARSRSAARFHSGRLDRPGQPGRAPSRAARRGRRTTADRLRARPRAAPRPRVRRAADRAGRPSTSCPT